jgi:hypothetical protein
MTSIDTDRSPRVRQGDIFTDVEFIEYATQKSGIIEVSKIQFPLVAVLSQDCDLARNFELMADNNARNHSRLLLSVIVAPVYNFQQFCAGEHLSDPSINLKMSQISEAQMINWIKRNQHARYHFLTFEKESGLVPEAVVDFKHYFTVTSRYLESIRDFSFKCKLSVLYREHLSQRFASFLARIGLPDETADQRPNSAILGGIMRK